MFEPKKPAQNLSFVTPRRKIASASFRHCTRVTAGNSIIFKCALRRLLRLPDLVKPQPATLPEKFNKHKKLNFKGEFEKKNQFYSLPFSVG